MAVVFVAGIAFAIGVIFGFCIGRDVRNQEVLRKQRKE